MVRWGVWARGGVWVRDVMSGTGQSWTEPPPPRGKIATGMFPRVVNEELSL